MRDVLTRSAVRRYLSRHMLSLGQSLSVIVPVYHSVPCRQTRVSNVNTSIPQAIHHVVTTNAAGAPRLVTASQLDYFSQTSTELHTQQVGLNDRPCQL